MKKAWISILYFITGILCIILQDKASFWPGFIAKSLIIPMLMILFIANTNSFGKRLNVLIFAGLFFSWAGDVTLEFTGSNPVFFILGLVSFLLAHVMYLTAFFSTRGKNYIPDKWYVMIPVIIYGVVLLAYLYPFLFEMRLPVVIYTAVIITMLTGAINRKKKVDSDSYYLVLAGAILFLVSDSALAVNKFRYQFEPAGIIIMVTYIAAQYLIVTGLIFQLKPSEAHQINR